MHQNRIGRSRKVDSIVGFRKPQIFATSPTMEYNFPTQQKNRSFRSHQGCYNYKWEILYFIVSTSRKSIFRGLRCPLRMAGFSGLDVSNVLNNNSPFIHCNISNILLYVFQLQASLILTRLSYTCCANGGAQLMHAATSSRFIFADFVNGVARVWSYITSASICGIQTTGHFALMVLYMIMAYQGTFEPDG